LRKSQKPGFSLYFSSPNPKTHRNPVSRHERKSQKLVDLYICRHPTQKLKDAVMLRPLPEPDAASFFNRKEGGDRRDGFIICAIIVIQELPAATKETGFFINYRAGTNDFRKKTRFLDTRG
jgi:hypothetical protein